MHCCGTADRFHAQRGCRRGARRHAVSPQCIDTRHAVGAGLAGGRVRRAERVKGGDGARRDSLPYTLKLAFTPDWGVRVGGDLHVTNTDSDGARLSGVGDTALILKRRFAVNEDAAFGVEAGVISATAKSGLGIGHTAWSLNGIYSADLGSYHLDINVAPVRLGEVDAG